MGAMAEDQLVKVLSFGASLAGLDFINMLHTGDNRTLKVERSGILFH